MAIWSIRSKRSRRDAVRRLSRLFFSQKRGRVVQRTRRSRPLGRFTIPAAFRCGIVPACGTIEASKTIVDIQGISMKLHRISVFRVAFRALVGSRLRLGASSKEMVQLQTQVQQLQEQMTAMQRSFDERMGVMKNLVEQDTDAVNKVANALNGLQTTLQKQQSEGGSKTDQLSGQIQSLNDTLDELKVRLGKVSKQLEDMQAAQQSLGAQQAQQQAQQQALKACTASGRAL